MSQALRSKLVGNDVNIARLAILCFTYWLIC